MRFILVLVFIIGLFLIFSLNKIGEDETIFEKGKALFSPNLKTKTNIGFEKQNAILEGWPQEIMGSLGFLWGGIISPVPVDLDGDGLLELVLTQQAYPSKLYVFEPDGNLKFEPIEVPEYCSQGNIDPRSFPSVGDIDNDGFKEIVVTCPTEEGSKILLYNHEGLLENEWSMDFVLSDTLYGTIVLDDINLDGNLELIYGGWWLDGSRLVALDNQGNMLPGFPIMLEDLQFSQVMTPAVGNLDEDKEKEIVVISWQNPWISSNIRAYDADGSELWEQQIDSLAVSDPVMGDINNDGYNEIAFTSEKGVYVLDKNGNFLLEKILGSNKIHSNVVLADLDNNNDLELIFGYAKSIYVMDWGGLIIWNKEIPNEINSGEALPPIVGDIDGDENPDILVSAGNDVFAWDAQGNEISGFPITINSNAYGVVSISDLDTDGDIELIASSDWFWEEDYNLGYVYVFDLESTYDQRTMEWPMFQHDPQHTGLYGYEQTNNNISITPFRCMLNKDCPEGYECQNHKCVLSNQG